jgi:HlyD family secretion protein
MRFLAIAAMLLTLCGCREQDPNLIQGYVEGEYVYVAAPYAASLEKLAVHRGQQIDKDVELFALDSRPQKAALDEADRRLAQARATLEDLRKGRRPTEIESLAAMLEQAQASLVRNKVEYDRIEKLEKSGASSTEELDAARSARDQDRARVTQLEADLKTANLGSREDQIAAAEATVKAQEAMLVKAEWDLSQMKQSSTKAGLVFDTLYREGEWVAAGRPVVMLLPPANIKVRAFVPEPRIGELKLGDQLEVLIDGVEKPFVGKVSYISAKAEYTPPIIYSRQSRSKLVFMIELTFDPEVAAELHPGQPLDVRLK